MNQVATYQKGQTRQEGLSIQTKIFLGVGAALALGFGVRWGYKSFQKIQSSKAESKSFTEGSSETLAKQIHMAFANDGWPGTNLTELRAIMTRVKSVEDWDRVVRAYKALYDKDLNRRIEDELQSSEFKEFLAIKGSKPKKNGQIVPGSTLYRAWAIRIKAAFEKTYGPFSGTDEKALDAVFNEIPTQRAYINVGRAYNKEYPGRDFTKDLKDEVDYDHYIKIILKKKQA